MIFINAFGERVNDMREYNEFDLWDIFYIHEERTSQHIHEHMKKHPKVEYSIKKRCLIKIKRLVLDTIWKFAYDSTKKSILMSGPRLGYVCEGLKKDYNLYLLNANSALEGKKYMRRSIKACPTDLWRNEFYCAFEKHDEKRLRKVYNKIANLLKKYNVQIVIISDFATFVNRLIGKVAKENGIPVVKYEHGALVTGTMSEALKKEAIGERKFFDYLWTWSTKNKEAYLKLGVGNGENTIVMGYPYQLPQVKKKEKRAMFVGEVIEPEHMEEYYSIVNNIYGIMNSLGLEMIYANHPKENPDVLKRYLNAGIAVVSGRLYQELERNLIVIGARTTAVLEAGLYRCITIQMVMDSLNLGGHVFGNAYVAGNYDEFKEIIVSIQNGAITYKPIDPYFLEMPDDITDKISGEIEQLLLKQMNNS